MLSPRSRARSGLLAALVLASAGACESKQMAQFTDVSGPSAATVIASPIPSRPEDFTRAGEAKLALFLTDADSLWLDLAQGLRSIGIPFTLTRDYREAIKHRVIFAYPLISGKALTAAALQSLGDYVRGGGTLIADNVLGGGMQDVFGFSEVKPGTARFEMAFQTSLDPLLKLDDPREKLIPFGTRGKGDPLPTNGYIEPRTPPLAVFDDGSAAITAQSTGQGFAYALGFDLGQLLYTGYANRDETIERAYVNTYEPTIDVCLRLLKAIYRRHEPRAVTLGTVPEGKRLAVLLTHDIDYAQSLANAAAYAELEKAHGVKATYFLQVKYVRDYNDEIFFSPKHLPLIHGLASLGMEIGSHSIAHSRQYAKFPLGDGHEAYPAYRPFVKTATETQGGTVLGELRVSKFLLESAAHSPTVVSFRPGELSNPYALPQALLATGFHFSSSVTANNSLTHLPFQLSYGREAAAALPIFEFPVTIEDEAHADMKLQLPEALQLAERLGRYGGLYVILIHPNVLGPKLEFERAFIEAWRSDAWFGTLAEFGQWWSARDALDLQVEAMASPPGTNSPAGEKITLRSDSAIHDVTLEIPAGWMLKSADPVSVQATQQDNHLLVRNVAGSVSLRLEHAQTPPGPPHRQ